MNDFLKSLSDKLSAYQLFNFIYPGAVFLGILHFYGNYSVKAVLCA